MEKEKIIELIKKAENLTPKKMEKDLGKPTHTFYPISSSYESAVSGNQTTVFRNKELIQHMID